MTTEPEDLVQLGPLDPELIEQALSSGGDLHRLEHERQTMVWKAKAAIGQLLKKCAQRAGGFRGQQTMSIEGSPAVAIANTKAHILIFSGELKHCNGFEELQAVWRALPHILEAHIAACMLLVEDTMTQRDVAVAIGRNTEIIETLLNEPTSYEEKRKLVAQVFTNAAFCDALTAADATGEPNAAQKVIRDQAGVTDLPSGNSRDVVTFFEVFVDQALKAEGTLPAVSLTYQTTGRHDLAWTLDFEAHECTPGIRSGVDAHHIIDFDLLHRILSERSTDLMQEYFRGNLHVSGDPMVISLTSMILARADALMQRQQ